MRYPLSFIVLLYEKGLYCRLKNSQISFSQEFFKKNYHWGQMKMIFHHKKNSEKRFEIFFNKDFSKFFQTKFSLKIL